MKFLCRMRPRLRLAKFPVAWMLLGILCGLCGKAASLAAQQATIVEVAGTVQTARQGKPEDWRPARTNEAMMALDRVRTRELSRAALRLRDHSLFRIGAMTELTIEGPDDSQSSTAVNMLRGVLMFFHRGNPKDVQFRTGAVSAAIRGTEFQVEVTENGGTVLTLFDGEVELSNPQGTLRLVSGEQASVDPGQPPVKTAAIFTRNELIQWCLYYPGVLDPAEVTLTAAEAAALQPSLAAYRSGDLLQALALVPVGYQPASDATRVYLAAVLLSVGEVDAAMLLLDAVPPDAAENSDKPPAPRLAGALRRLALVVKNSPALGNLAPAPRDPKCATLRLAESYEYQAAANLTAALDAARDAVTISPTFAFGWARVAELEFSFGRRREAQAALARSLELGPRNAQAVALRGFLLAAENRISAAHDAFNEAIALEGALGNAWLGRGLCRIRRGDLHAGREDLQVAALMEPQRALFRSYLGKAWNELGEQRRASDELRLAKENDPRDPTAYLYEALLLQEENRINEAVTALEHSQELNDNRRVYRSRLLLDQDAAVRGANLASIYRDVGMTDWSAREAGKAVNADYANWSAHLFLANSYNELRDPLSVNQRYETPALSEYLIANLLSPASAGTLAQRASQQEYSSLFARDRLGFASTTEYLSRGAWSQSAAQYGSIGQSAYSVEGVHVNDSGERANNDLEQTALSVRLKHDLGPADGFYLEASAGRTVAGDLNQLPDNSLANRMIRVRDEAGPLLLAGYHHEWAPGHHTLVLASRLEGDLNVRDGQAFGFLTRRVGDELDLLHLSPFTQRYDSEFAIHGAEIQQLWRRDPISIVAGVKGQFGEFDTDNRHGLTGNDPYDFIAFSSTDPVPQSSEARFERETAYAYAHWQALDSLQLIGGVAYDRLTYPANYRYAPVSGGTDFADDWLPKAGFIWQAAKDTAVRFAWTRSLGGASFDQSFRLEPVQVAGFNQAFRSLIPETLVGANAGAPFETFDLAWEHRFPTRTYVSLGGAFLQSRFSRQSGAYVWDGGGSISESTITERLDYDERGFAAQLHQLLGSQFALSAGYSFAKAQLDASYPQAQAVVETGFDDNGYATFGPVGATQRGDLHQLNLRLLWNHPNGWFAGTDGAWFWQEMDSRTTTLAEANFWQWHAHAGWRSPRRRVETRIALLNVLDDHDGLHPINLHRSPLTERTLATSLRLNF